MPVVDVLAIIKTKPGQRDAVLSVFQSNRPLVLAEEGCIAYDATIDAANAGPNQTLLGDDVFVVVEKWSCMDALAAHSKAPHMQEYASQTHHLLEDRTIHILQSYTRP